MKFSLYGNHLTELWLQTPLEVLLKGRAQKRVDARSAAEVRASCPCLQRGRHQAAPHCAAASQCADVQCIMDASICRNRLRAEVQ